MAKGVQIEQEIDDEVPYPVMAKTILQIDAAMQSLKKSGLKDRAIVALVHDSTRVPKTTIVEVLRGLRDLKKNYLEPGTT